MADNPISSDELTQAKEAAVSALLEKYYVPTFVDKCASEGLVLGSPSEVAHAVTFNTKVQALMSKGSSMDDLVDLLVDRIGLNKQASHSEEKPITLADINYSMDDLCKAAGLEIEGTPLEAKQADELDPVDDEDLAAAQVLFAELPETQ